MNNYKRCVVVTVEGDEHILSIMKPADERTFTAKVRVVRGTGNFTFDPRTGKFSEIRETVGAFTRIQNATEPIKGLPWTYGALGFDGMLVTHTTGVVESVIDKDGIFPTY